MLHRVAMLHPAEIRPGPAARKVLAITQHKDRRFVAHAEAIGDVQAAHQLAVLLKRHVDRLKTSDGRVDWRDVACVITTALGGAQAVRSAASDEAARREGVVRVLAERLQRTVDKHISAAGLVDWVDVASDLVAWMKDNQR